MARAHIEFITLGKGGALTTGSPENVIRGDAPVSMFVEVDFAPTAANARPVVPNTGEWGQAVRVIATDADMLMTWDKDGVNVSDTNSLYLVTGIPEVVVIADGSRLSFINAAPQVV